MSSLNLNVSLRKREPSRGSLQIEEERSVFGRPHSSVKEKKTIDPAPSVRRLEEMLAKEKDGGKEKEKDRDFFGKIYSSMRERKTPPPPDIVPSLQRLEEMIAKEAKKDKEKERERRDTEKMRKKTKTKEDKYEGNELNTDALRKLEDFYKANSPSSSPSSRLAPSPSASPVENPKMLLRKDSLRSLPSYHSHKTSQSRSKEKSLKVLSIKRDVSAMEIDASQKKRGTFSYARWRRAEGDEDNASVASRGKRAMSSPKGSDDGSMSRKHVEKLTSRFEDLRKANIDRIQSTLSIPSEPIIVSSRLPTTLLPPLTLSRPTKRKKQPEAWSNTKPSSSFRIPLSPPPQAPLSLSPRSPRSPRIERPAPSSNVSVSNLPVIESNDNINNIINHNTKADTLRRERSSSAIVSSSNNNKPPTTDILINYSVMTTDDNTTNITITPSSPNSKWFSGLTLSKTEIVQSPTKPRAYSVDGRSTSMRELHVSAHRQAKDDLFL